MLLPVSWLRPYLPKLPPTPKLVETLMMHGLDVEEVISGRDDFNNVVVGEIVAIKPHPNADKLRIAEVVVGSDKSNSAGQEIVCGAPNIKVGQKVPVALVGAKLPNGITIEPRAIRGITSNGMICAEDELGLGQGHAGVLILDAGVKVGTPFAEALLPGDDVIDLAIPANRADLMAMRGLAWEIGAMLGQKPKFTTTKDMVREAPSKGSVTVQIADQHLCLLLTARIIRGVAMKPTPMWIVDRLKSAGMRSVNIIADITNYVMLEYGQPLHAYDADKVRGQTLIVRSAKAGEKLKTLDGKTRTLTPEMLVIADAERVIGLAGVMGGEDTEVTDATTEIILEAAIFDPVAIRKTSRQLGLMSEASKRFEKGLWPCLPTQASAAAAAMIVELCGGTAELGMASVGKEKNSTIAISLDPKYISQRLGMTITPAKCKTILTTLGFDVKGTAKSWKVIIPEWRIDVSLPEDIVDEVGRMVGYEKLPKAMPAVDANINDLPSLIRFKEEVKNILVDMGMTEVISHAFYGKKSAGMIQGQHFEVANPLDETQHMLRKSLIPQITNVLHREADAGHDAMIFEVGRVFDPTQKGNIEGQQRWKLAIGFAQKPDSSSPMILSEVSQKFFAKLGANFDLKDISSPDDVFRARRLKYGELDLIMLMKASKPNFGSWDFKRHIKENVKYVEQSKYPAIVRDISFWAPEGFNMHNPISKLNLKPLLSAYKIIDRFQKGEKISYTVSFKYQSPDRTLTKAEVDKIEEKIKDGLIKLGANIR